MDDASSSTLPATVFPSSLHEPGTAVPPPRIVLIGARPTPVAEPGPDAALCAILDAPLARGETAFAGFARKESELGAAFAALAVPAARALHARLANPKPGDPVAERFGRLTFDRRHRLLAFLADARRRAAVSARR